MGGGDGVVGNQGVELAVRGEEGRSDTCLGTGISNGRREEMRCLCGKKNNGECCHGKRVNDPADTIRGDVVLSYSSPLIGLTGCWECDFFFKGC